MTRRSYEQFCGLACALDVVGERWTLLIVRELMSGPKRYSDLAAALDGIGTSLLAARVRQLELDGVLLRRHLGPPIASTIYQLTPVGHELADAVVPLALWGARHHLPDRRDSQSFRAEWSLVFLIDVLDPDALRDIEATYEIRADDSTARIDIRDGRAEVHPGPRDEPADAVLTSDSATLAAIAAGALGIADALRAQRIDAAGDPHALETLLALLQAALNALYKPH